MVKRKTIKICGKPTIIPITPNSFISPSPIASFLNWSLPKDARANIINKPHSPPYMGEIKSEL
jgi:hypothetical protein